MVASVIIAMFCGIYHTVPMCSKVNWEQNHKLKNSHYMAERYFKQQHDFPYLCEFAQLSKSREKNNPENPVFEFNNGNWIFRIKFVTTYASTLQADLKKFNTDLNRELKVLQKVEKIRLRNPADRQSIVSFTYRYHYTFMRNTFYLLMKPLWTTNITVSKLKMCSLTLLKLRKL